MKKVEFHGGFKYGQFRKGTCILEGIGRIEFNDGQIQEGQFTYSKMDGYARVIFTTGDYFIGHFKNNKK